MRKKRTVLDILILLLAIVFVFSSVMVVRSMREYSRGRAEYNELKEQMILRPSEEQEESPYLTFDFDGLREVNDDFLFWIDIPGTGISYPVVQGPDNDYYLRRTFSGEWNVGGVIFEDYRCPDDLSGLNTLIYGHRMNDGSMFTALRKYVDASYLDEHAEVHLYRDGEVLIYRVFSCRKTDVFDDCYTVYFDNANTYSEWLRTQCMKSAVFTGIEPGLGDQILTLSTCAGNGEELGRYVVQAVLEETIPLS